MVLAAFLTAGCSARLAVYEDVTLLLRRLRMEDTGVAPGPGFVWIGGYWRWAGNDYAWTPRALGAPAAERGGLGSRLLGTPAQRVSMARRPLALREVEAIPAETRA